MPETQLRTTLTLNNGQFIAACDDSQARTGKFQNAVGGGTGNFVKFNGEILKSRRAMHLLGEAAGVNLGKISQIAHGFDIFGIAVGSTIGAMILFHAAMEEGNRVMQEAADHSKNFWRTMRDVRMEAEGLEFNKAAKELEHIGDAMAIVQKDMAKMESNMFERLGKVLSLDFGTMKEYLEQNSEAYRNLQEEIKAGGRTADTVRKRLAAPDIKHKDEQHGGGGAAHIGQAHYGNELGAYKAEHGSSLVDIARKTLEVQEKTLVVLEKRTTPREPGDLADNF